MNTGYLGNSTSESTWYLGPHNGSSAPSFIKVTTRSNANYSGISEVIINNDDYVYVSSDVSELPYIRSHLNSDMHAKKLEFDLTYFGYDINNNLVTLNDLFYVTNNTNNQLNGTYLWTSFLTSSQISHNVYPGEDVYIGFNASGASGTHRNAYISNFKISNLSSDADIQNALTSIENKITEYKSDINTIQNQYETIIETLTDINNSGESSSKLNDVSKTTNLHLLHFISQKK